VRTDVANQSSITWDNVGYFDPQRPDQQLPADPARHQLSGVVWFNERLAPTTVPEPDSIALFVMGMGDAPRSFKYHSCRSPTP
jgi:hypothetical protein